ncbi:hypothetical protein TTHERM_00193290 (macronuclear) [Tetrahymena thermophila SB210]|uniref:Uncharacterized protein n=1 Tax=Tetrahymena thermophila (strain SB210) TaxID=312017 RepID=Q23KK6_TETTS|nr:hypothetical protein TTHERM_00193290 [Tetrahymena thermophila SB210]EAR96837.2 hypothetical protein TTHERM_00193290 [Tetrahymena thermophila SB210]|eukprot:XP_001017082.2 hypothetical protein TTHERM_00193290 [Tetrahymena thermophila SB210]
MKQQYIKVESIISSIVNKYDDFLGYQDTLNNILKFIPQPTATDQDDHNQQKYVDDIKKLKHIVYELLDFPQKYNCLQNSIQDIIDDYNKVHMDLNNHINNLIQLTYNIEQENLGDNFQKLNEISNNLEQCKFDGQNLQQTLFNMDKVSDFIKEYFSTCYGQQLSNLKSKLEDYKEELEYEIQQSDLEQKQVLKHYQEASLQITQKNAIIQTHLTQQQLFKKDIYEIQLKIKKLEENMQKKINGVGDSNTQQLQQTFQQEVQNQKIQINDLIIKKESQNSKIEELRTQIGFIKLDFLNKIIQLTWRLEQTDIEEELSKKLKSIQDAYQTNINEIQQKIKEANKKIQDQQLKQEKTYIQLGFQNYQHFKKFNCFYDTVKDIYFYYINLIQDILSLIKQLSFQNQAFQESQKNFEMYREESNNLLYQHDVFTRFKQIDQSINQVDSFSSIKKILFIINSSIEQKCKEEKQEAFYDHVIRSISFYKIIKNFVDLSKKEQDQYFVNDIIPEIIRVPNNLRKLENRNKIFLEKIRKKQKIITNLNDDLKEEVDSQKKQEIQEEIKECENDLKEMNTDFEEIQEELEDIKHEFETDNSDQINIIKDVVFALKNANNFALLEKKKYAIQASFNQLLKRDQSFIKALKQYKTLAIECGSKN